MTMQRTDTEMLTWLLGILQLDDTPDAESEARGQALAGAILLKLKGRVAITAAMQAWMPKPGEQHLAPTTTGLNLIELECERVRDVEGFSTERDDQYVRGELASAAACYAMPEDERSYCGLSPEGWPSTWDDAWWKPGDRLRELSKAGQLIAAEMDRLIRAKIAAGPYCAPTGTVTALGDPCVQCGNIDTHDVDCTLGAEIASVGDVHFTAHALVEQPPARCSPDQIRVGLRVRVFQSAPEWEGWVPAMGKLVGNIYIVEERVEAMRTHPATVKVGDWHIPAACCEIVL
jgi:hypothetical protein